MYIVVLKFTLRRQFSKTWTDYCNETIESLLDMEGRSAICGVTDSGFGSSREQASFLL